jgi:hypothetical protein
MSSDFVCTSGVVELVDESLDFDDDDPQATSAGTRARVATNTPAAITRDARRGEEEKFMG